MHSYRKKLLLYYLGVFLIFLLIVGGFQYYMHTEYKNTMIESNLNTIVFLTVAFLLMLILLWIVTKKFSLSISKLKDFALNAGRNEDAGTDIDFPDDEIGLIGKQIMSVYADLRNAQSQLKIEKERLYRHLSVIKEGVALFSHKKETLLVNKNFIRYVNLISKKTVSAGTDIFKLGFMKKLNEFIDKNLNSDELISQDEIVEKVLSVKRDNRYYNLKCIIFSDKSFEIIITDETKREKNKVIKSQITSNIAHELKTPVSAIHAYLETILQNTELKKEQKRYFIKKAFGQVQRLSQLISDISTINKLDYAEEFFELSKVNLYLLVEEIKVNTLFRREENKIELYNNLDKKLVLTCNKELMYSIFQNLVENTINYAGTDIDIIIKLLYEDEEFYHFSYLNTGANIPEEHLNRIFERFYRVDSGRTRKSGGTGLGLSITKNAVEFHHGDISAKNLPKGGVEFLFTIKKM